MFLKWMLVLLLAFGLSGGANAAEPLKWVDFDIPVEALETALQLDVDSQGREVELDWVDILAFAATKNGSGKLSTSQVRRAAEELDAVNSPAELFVNQMKYYE